VADSQPQVNPLLWKAIEERPDSASVKARERIIEPHDYGVHNGVGKILRIKWPGRAPRATELEMAGGKFDVRDRTTERGFAGSRPLIRASITGGKSCSSEWNRMTSGENSHFRCQAERRC